MKKIIACAILAVGFAAAVSFAESTGPTSAPAPNEVDYVKQLPNPNDLVKANVPAGSTVSAITETSSDITVTYSYANGQVRVVSYRLLPAAGSSAAAGTMPTPATPAPGVVCAPTSPGYTVVYEQPAPVYYYPAYGYGYYPWAFPVSVGIGFRGGWGFHGGWGFRGGFRR
jgi:hypothetical protein